MHSRIYIYFYHIISQFKHGEISIQNIFIIIINIYYELIIIRF
jgi:hypothetical protein